MDIGAKLKDARLSAELTQERAAELLGVSRQTLSNWENEKTYPDILSVVKMSDVYNISLDRLLKDEKSPVNYLNYLEKSMDTVKSHDRRSKLILVSSYLLIWAFAILVFWLFTSPSDAMGYSLMFLYGLLPISTFVFSCVIGKNNYFGKVKWLVPIVFGVMYMLAEYLTFSASNMSAFEKFNMPQFEMILIGGVISALGIAAGRGIEHLNTRVKNKADQL